MEDFDFPTHGVPIDLLDGLGAAAYWHIRDQFPLDRFSAFRRATLAGMDHCQVERRVSFLFADRRQHGDALEPDLQCGLGCLALVIAHFDVMKALDVGLLHLGCNRMAAVAGKPIDAGADEEVRAQIVREAEQFINVAFAITDMNATLRLTEAFDRLPEILKPANTFLLLDGNTGWVDLLFERGCPFELLA